MTVSFPSPPLALFGNLDITEILVIVVFAVMVFGRDLPKVAAQVLTQVTRARKALQEVWRESGIGDEIRQVQRDLEVEARKLRDADPRQLASKSMREIEAEVRDSKPLPKAPTPKEPDLAPTEEPMAERRRVPSWYPEALQEPDAPAEPEDFSALEDAPATPSASEAGDGRDETPKSDASDPVGGA